MHNDRVENAANCIALRALLVVLYLVLLSACGHHQPAPVEEHSTALAKSQVNSDDAYFVRPGDTLYAIAFKFGLDPHKVSKWNEINTPYVIYPGQKLRLSAPSFSSGSRGNSAGVKISTAKSPGQATTKAASSPTKSVATKPGPVAKAKSITKPAAASKTTISKTGDPKSWKWPTQGGVLRTYVAGDPARNGLDIAGKEGQAITASASGQVVYSGSGLIGYGELIIIKHSEKMLSAYAHNKVRLAKEGEQVTGGQKIAQMGRNTANEQLLHFEIRAHGKPVNPLIYLPKK